jgi:hypothetical protein
MWRGRAAKADKVDKSIPDWRLARSGLNSAVPPDLVSRDILHNGNNAIYSSNNDAFDILVAMCLWYSIDAQMLRHGVK